MPKSAKIKNPRFYTEIPINIPVVIIREKQGYSLRTKVLPSESFDGPTMQDCIDLFKKDFVELVRTMQESQIQI